MSDVIGALGEALRTALIWQLNGFLALLYTTFSYLAALLTAAACFVLLWWQPDGHPAPVAQQRPWLLSVAGLALLAAFIGQPPAPLLLAVMSVAGAAAVYLDKFNPNALRWRVAGGLALYALASLAYLAYSRYLAALDATAWAEAIGGQGQALMALAQGKAFVDTLAVWGLWLILPLAFFALLVQGVLVHPPLPGSPQQIFTAVRTRGEDR